MTDEQATTEPEQTQAPDQAAPAPEDDPIRRPPRPDKQPSRISKGASRAKEAAYEKTPDRFKNASSLQVRFRTGFVYVALSVVCVLVSDVTTVIYLALVSAVCAGEFYFMMRADDKMPNEGIGIIAAALYPIAMWLLGSIGTMLVTVLFMMAVFVWYVYWKHARVQDVAICIFGAMYTGLLLSVLIPLRAALPAPWGGVLLLGLFCSVWFNDAGAYLVGSKIGKHKLAPQTSPKKSWEGFIAGLVVSAVFWCLFTLIPGVEMPLWMAAIFGVLCGVAGVLGDLTESRIKRNVGVKDSGTIMPGHGGLLDRMDSMFLCAVVGALLLFGAHAIPFVW